MKKIPVGATIAHAYRFAFGNALTVFKAIWLPLLAQLALVLLLMRRTALFLAAAQAHDPSAASLFGPLLLLFPLLLVFFFAQFTAATEAALGRPPQSRFAFHFNRPMWRLLGGFLTALGAIAAIALITLVVLLVLAFGLQVVVKAAPGSQPFALMLGRLLIAVFLCVIVFAGLRFLFLLAPLNISEQQLGVRRAWELSAGNFWRILLITLAITIPIGFINQVYALSLTGLPPALPAGTSKEAQDAAETAWQVTELNLMAERWYLSLPLTGLLMLFQFGAGCAAQAFAYRVLTDKEGSAPVAGHRLPD